MPLVCYQENTRQHAHRLRVTLYFARMRRRVLAARLEGRALPSNAPTHLRQATPQTLMATLAVKPHLQRDEGEEETLVLIPTSTPATQDRLQGQNARRRQRRRLALGKSSPPYGYRRTHNEAIVPDPDAAHAIQLAFALILTFAARGGRAPWALVAVELNAAGYVRQNGKPWTGEHVRALTHTPLYAGYARTNRRGLGDAIESAANITEPLVDLQTFVQAARLAHRTTPLWLDELASLAVAVKHHHHARKAA
jgi:hypothetical protein